MGKVVYRMRMEVRWKAPKIGDVVRVIDSEMHLHLPAGLLDRTDAVVLGREPGRYIVRALGRIWNIAMQCVMHEEEWCLQGEWFDRWDRRVRHAQARLASQARHDSGAHC